jgi:hypothetical protein
MIKVAVDIVKKHLEEYHPDEEFNIFDYGGKEFTFHSRTRWNVKVVLGLVDNKILFDIQRQVKKKKILEGQLRLIGGMKYTEVWDYYGYGRNI